MTTETMEVVTRPEAVTSIFVQGRTWFDKVNGNSYFSNQVSVNGRVVLPMGMEYGYGDQHLFRAIQELVRRSYLPEGTQGTADVRELGITLYYSNCDVQKRELYAANELGTK